MPRSETIISVFVASPSDVSEERKSLDSIVSELNKTWSKNLNLRLDLIKWETDTHPGFGDYSQDVINTQINDEYDVFLAIFWSKIGTETKSALSGTLEEFDRAYKKYLDDRSSIDIMVYFKDQAISPSKIDLAQMQKIQDLKNQLGEKGGLYWTFESTDDFESLLRSHLSKIAQKWSTKTPISFPSKVNDPEDSNSIPLGDDSSLDDEFGLLDYIEIYEDRMFDMTSALSSMAEATEKIGNQFNKRTEEINKLKNINGQTDIKKARKIIKLSGDDMERFSEITEAQLKITSKSRGEALDALSKALSLYVDFKGADPDDSLSELEESLQGMRDAAFGTRDSLTSFRESMSNLPRLTIQLNKAKRKAVGILDKFLEELDTTVDSTNDVLQIIADLKKI